MFGARVLAAAPRVALVPDPVYVWHVRRSAARLSISLDRSGIANWRARTEADRHVVRHPAGRRREGARAGRRGRKFLDHELRMYVRELELRGAEYRREWWELTRAHLAAFDAGDFAPARPRPAGSSGGCPRRRGAARSARLKEMAARPARLCSAVRPCRATARPSGPTTCPRSSWSHLLSGPCAAARRRGRGAAATRAGRRLRLRLHELYGRVAGRARRAWRWSSAAGGRAGGVRRPRPVRGRRRRLDGGGGRRSRCDLAALGQRHLGPAASGALRGRRRPRDHRARRSRAPGCCAASALPSTRHGVLLVQPYATHAAARSRCGSRPGRRGADRRTRVDVRRLLH